MKLAAIGDDIFVSLWRFIGVEGYSVKSSDEFSKIFERLLKSDEYSALMIPESFLDLASKILEATVREGVEPLLIVVPERGSRKRVEDLRRKISMAMGVEIKF